MKKFVLLLLGITFGTCAYADVCDDFKSSASIEALASEINVQAGSDIKLPIKITMDETQVKRWKYINFSAGLHNDIHGSRTSFDAYALRHSGGSENPQELLFQTTTAMGGFYKVGAVIYAQDASYDGFCVMNQDLSSNLKIEIANKPELIDIHPPVLKNIQFKQEVYKAGDTLELVFQAQDKSDICTVWKEQSGMCHSGTHVELKAIDSDDTISFHTPTPIFKMAEQESYLALVPLSEQHATKDIKPGMYKLAHFMFRDVHGNFVDTVPEGLGIEVKFE